MQTYDSTTDTTIKLRKPKETLRVNAENVTFTKRNWLMVTLPDSNTLYHPRRVCSIEYSVKGEKK